MNFDKIIIFIHLMDFPYLFMYFPNFEVIKQVVEKLSQENLDELIWKLPKLCSKVHCGDCCHDS